MKSTLISLMLCLISSPILAKDDAFIMEFEIMAGESLILTPAMTVMSGQKTSVEVQDTYKLSVVATASENETVYVAIDFTVDGETVSPKVLVTLGQPVIVKVSDTTVSMVIREFAQAGT